MCQRVVGDEVETSYVKTCGTCTVVTQLDVDFREDKNMGRICLHIQTYTGILLKVDPRLCEIG